MFDFNCGFFSFKHVFEACFRHLWIIFFLSFFKTRLPFVDVVNHCQDSVPGAWRMNTCFRPSAKPTQPTATCMSWTPGPEYVSWSLVWSGSSLVSANSVSGNWSLRPYLTYLNPSCKLTEANDTKEINLLKDTNLGDQFPNNPGGDFLCLLIYIQI